MSNMSSHYIYVQCNKPDCDSFESIWTGDVELDDFDDNAWEGEAIKVTCKHHKEEDLTMTELFDHIQDTLGPAFTVMDGGLVNDVQTVYVRINNPYKEE